MDYTVIVMAMHKTTRETGVFRVVVDDAESVAEAAKLGTNCIMQCLGEDHTAWPEYVFAGALEPLPIPLPPAIQEACDELMQRKRKAS